MNLKLAMRMLKPVFLVLFVALMSCSNTSQEQTVITDIPETIISQELPVAESPNTQQESTNSTISASEESQPDEESYAIGKIRFETNQSEFESEKRTFLQEHSTLGGLRIKELKGFFFQGKLAAIQIVSENCANKSCESWKDMYRQKYGFFLGEINTSDKKIKVVDHNANYRLATSLADAISYEFKEIELKRLSPYKTDLINEMGAIISAQEVLDALGDKNIRSQYDGDMNAARSQQQMGGYGATYRVAERYYRSYYEQARASAERYNAMHKNDPKYSMLIIMSKKMLNLYNKEQQNKKDAQKKRDIDIL